MAHFSFEIQLPGKAEARVALQALHILMGSGQAPSNEALDRACATPEATGAEDLFPPDGRRGEETPEAYDLAAELLRNMLDMPNGRELVDGFTPHGECLLGFKAFAAHAENALEFCCEGGGGRADAAAFAASALLKTHGGEPVGFTCVDGHAERHDLAASAYICTAEGIRHLDVNRWAEQEAEDAQNHNIRRPATHSDWPGCAVHRVRRRTLPPHPIPNGGGLLESGMPETA